VASAQLQAVKEVLVGIGRMAPDVPLDAQRAVVDALGSMRPPPDGVEVTPLGGEAPAGEWVSAQGADGRRVVLYLHGGGYCVGSAVSHRLLAAELSVSSGARVLVLDYRRAPEHRFPAAFDDAVVAYHWLLGQGHDPAAIAVAGDSAGGGLTLAALVALRDGGLPLPGAGVCISPWGDVAGRAASLATHDDRDYVLSAAWLSAMAAHYLGDADRADPRASPLAAELGGLPPLLVLVGSEEVLYDDALAVAERARAAGVACELEVFEDCAHWWMLAGAGTPEATAGVERVGRFLRARLA